VIQEETPITHKLPRHIWTRSSKTLKLGHGSTFSRWVYPKKEDAIKGPDDPTSQLLPIIRKVVAVAQRKKKRQRRWWRVNHFKSSISM
jgi:hypothetical protein